MGQGVAGLVPGASIGLGRVFKSGPDLDLGLTLLVCVVQGATK